MQSSTDTVVVTGAGTGIGFAVAEQFVRAGADVVITGRRREVLQRAAVQIGARPVVCDNADPTQLQDLARACAGGVHVLVNNAGGNTDIGANVSDDGNSGDGNHDVDNHDVDNPDDENASDDHGDDPGAGLSAVAESWLANYRANVLTAVLTTTALEPLMTSGSRVINLGSIAAESGVPSYGPVKAAVQSWTVSLAQQLGPRGITVNTVAPGFIADTEFFGPGGLSEARLDALRAATATGRLGEVQDIAALVAFLASNGAGHITGQTLHVNGGALTTR